MGRSGIEQRLYDAIAALEIIDAHEHLPPEKDYLAHAYCGPNFFAGYIWQDLESAGMPLEFKNTMRDAGHTPVEAWWPQIAPYWKHAKHGSYARAALITARDLYGIEDINDDTIHALAEQIASDNVPGLYRRILRDHCNIRLAITCQEHTRYENDPLLRPITFANTGRELNRESVEAYGHANGIAIRSLDDLVAADREDCRRLKDAGAIGFKTVAAPRPLSSEAEARAAFERMQQQGACEDTQPLAGYLFGKMLETAADLDLPVAVHAGVWGNFRQSNPTWMIPWVVAHPRTRFDLFHLGMPYAREAIIMAKNFPNLYLNLCWCYVLSETVSLQALDEIIDLVPVNKIIAFGGDYRVVVQKVYGHLVMARETIARALARRVERGDFAEGRALEIAEDWFVTNPEKVYNL